MKNEDDESEYDEGEDYHEVGDDEDGMMRMKMMRYGFGMMRLKLRMRMD